ncbi:MAG: HAD hydrolase family protein [Myxococcota bacterium]|jgi:HAD superfamily hydrolase (TIGR01484 family)|nr:HAD hydrolase family protein [Myxococcota bacterium]
MSPLPSFEPRQVLFVVDLDGTLLRSDRRFNPQDLDALQSLRRLGVSTAVATGRSLLAFHKALIAAERETLPLDAVVVSNGAAIFEVAGNDATMPTAWSLVEQHGFDDDQRDHILQRLLETGRNFALHQAVPENHRFHYHRGDEASDFLLRLRLHQDRCQALDWQHLPSAPSQFLMVLPSELAQSFAEDLARSLAPLELSMLRSTSPFDARFTWLELYPPQVDKGQACRRWGARCGRPVLVAVGNDYNDLHMLEAAALGLVVANAAPELRARFESVPSNDEGGVAQAAQSVRELIRKREGIPKG